MPTLSSSTLPSHHGTITSQSGNGGHALSFLKMSGVTWHEDNTEPGHLLYYYYSNVYSQFRPRIMNRLYNGGEERASERAREERDEREDVLTSQADILQQSRRNN